jgi:hypothetical protein
MTKTPKTVRECKAIIKDLQKTIELYELDLAAAEEKINFLEHNSLTERLKRLFRF